MDDLVLSLQVRGTLLVRWLDAFVATRTLQRPLARLRLNLGLLGGYYVCRWIATGWWEAWRGWLLLEEINLGARRHAVSRANYSLLDLWLAKSSCLLLACRAWLLSLSRIAFQALHKMFLFSLK